MWTTINKTGMIVKISSTCRYQMMTNYHILSIEFGIPICPLFGIPIKFVDKDKNVVLIWNSQFWTLDLLQVHWYLLN